MVMTELSLVVPCHNEAANLPLLVGRCREVFTGGSCEVILVDNGSTDDTPARLPRLLDGQDTIRSIRVEPNRGYGGGILAGLHAAEGKVLAWTHADMQTDPGDALRGLELFRRSPHPQRLFVKGRRHGRRLGDVVFTTGMSIFESVLFMRRLWDINAQPTMFGRSFFTTWKNPPSDFSLDLFAYASARAAGLSVERIPVHFGERAHGRSTWNLDWRAKMKFARRTVAYSLKLRAEAWPGLRGRP
jgi:glycosyltransferase involved in cell wall biosynthesis